MFQHLSRRVKKFWASAALLSIEMILVIGLFTVALITFVFLVRRVFVLKRTNIDDRVFSFLETHVNDRNNAVMQAFTFLGTHEFLIPANLGLIAWFLFVKKHKWHSIKLPAIALSSVGLMFVLKRLFNRPRPDIPLIFEAKGLSFPSGHALMSVTFYGLLIYMVYKSNWPPAVRWSVIVFLALLIMVIGLTRVYLRVHYASDVLAGYCIGFLWLVFAIWMLNRLEKYSRARFDRAVQAPA